MSDHTTINDQRSSVAHEQTGESPTPASLTAQVIEGHDPIPVLVPAYYAIRAAGDLGLLSIPSGEAWQRIVDAFNVEAGSMFHVNPDLSAAVPYLWSLEEIDRYVEEVLGDLATSPDPLFPVRPAPARDAARADDAAFTDAAPKSQEKINLIAA